MIPFVGHHRVQCDTINFSFCFILFAYVFIFTCAALNGSHCSGRRPWWRRRKYEQRPPSFSLFFSSTALVDCPHIAVASHPKGSWHWKSVHVVHGPSHGLRLHLTVDLLNLPIYLHLTQLVDKKKLENREKIKGFNPIWRTFIIIIISDLHVWCLFFKCPLRIELLFWRVILTVLLLLVSIF